MSNVDDAEQQDLNDAEMEAAFAASFNGASEPVVEQAKQEPEVDANADANAEKVEDKDEKEPGKKDTQQAPPAAPTLSEDQLKLLAAIPELEKRLTQQVDRVSGNYGEIKRLLEDTKKAAATAKSATEFDASADGDYIDKEFPELAEGIKAKISQAVGGIKPTMTPEQFEEMYVARRKAEETAKRNELIEILNKNHPDQLEIIATPEWKAWADSLPPHQHQSLHNSQDPYYVSGMISKFKSHRDEQAAKAKKSQKRIENAVTPNGVRPVNPTTISDEEAAQKAFEDQFK